MLRTHTCGQLNTANIGQKVKLCGWVVTRRDHGGLVFLDLRDREGVTQIVFNPEENKELHQRAQDLRSEFVVLVSGEVRQRPAGTENLKLRTGEIEIVAHDIKLLNKAQTPPFEILDNINVAEDLRLEYRYLDLRRPKMYNNFFLRHKVCKIMRDYLDAKGFLEVETPILTKSTPEGARDYLVPSRLNIGKFYALPQSPQLFKQLLMVSGFDKYYQIAKCFRDEDLRADRQPEFTQLDLEMSFLEEDDIYLLMEGLFKDIFSKILKVELKIPFRRLTYQEAMDKFGSDKPDTRFGLELIDLTAEFSKTKFEVFSQVVKNGGLLKAIKVEGAADFSRSQIDELTKIAKENGAKGLAYFKILKNEIQSPIAKFLSKEELDNLLNKTKAEENDLLLLVADKFPIPNQVLGLLRLILAQQKNLIKENSFDFLWVTDFPLFKYNPEEKRWDPEHHPFTSPKEEDLKILETKPQEVKSRAYDLIVNGVEIGGGSIRIHRQDLQEKIFKLIGIEKKEAEERFGFLLEAFKYGAPPHGGIALGLDRLIALLINADSIREVIAFPKTQKAYCPLTHAPSDVSKKQLKELGLTSRG
jgi:aspartyl-tRNA synthetase